MNCSFCYNCENLNGKSYCINNSQLSKKEYFEQISKLGFASNEEKNGYKGRRMFQGTQNENVSGNYIYNSKDAQNCFFVKNLDNGKNCSFLTSSSRDSSDCYDYDYFGGSTRVYESITVGSNSDEVLFSANTWYNTSHVYYSYFCYACRSVFGCVGLKDKQYCIFNKQYSKDDYEFLVAKIIPHMQKNGEWGDFFPAYLSPFGYNESLANDAFPLSEEKARESGFNWSNYEAPRPKVDKIIPASKLPDTISDIPDDILNWAIECEATKKPFRIMKQELAFYRKHGIPIPKRHPNRRYLDRIQQAQKPRISQRKCDKYNS